MIDVDEKNEIENIIHKYSSKFDHQKKEAVVILAAGHGKRIKSQTSKMLHKIWGVPTVERVYSASKHGLQNSNIILVVGIKAKDVMEVIGKRDDTIFAYQKEQNGTGHAVKIGLQPIDEKIYDGDVYVLPGDMGLIDEATIEMFRDAFKSSSNDMMVLTGLYKGDPWDNNYGRITRVKAKDVDGNSAGKDEGKVIEIMEHKDILSLPQDEPYRIEFNGRYYSYTKDELIRNNEFNSGVYAFHFKKLHKFINEVKSNNVQKEIYVTDLISIFNKNGLTVGAVSPQDQNVIMGFNNKSVLKDMEMVARKKTYAQLKDIIEIADKDDFFIDEEVIEQIIKMDSEGIPLDIQIEKGVYIGKGVKLNFNLHLKKNVFVEGNVIFGRNVTVWQNVHLSCFDDQQFVIEDNVEILWGDIIKGNIIIGKNSRIESSVNMTGSNNHPLRIGKNVLIKGTSYIFGSVIEDDIHIEHSVLINKKVEKLIKKDGTIQPVRFFLPLPEGIDAIEEL